SPQTPTPQPRSPKQTPPTPKYTAKQIESATIIQSWYRTRHQIKKSLNKLTTLSTNLVTKFGPESTWPTYLSETLLKDIVIDPTTNTIAFNTKQNRPLLEAEEALTKMLLELDAVESFGDLEVRDARRELIKSVQRRLDEIERGKRGVVERVVGKKAEADVEMEVEEEGKFRDGEEEENAMQDVQAESGEQEEGFVDASTGLSPPPSGEERKEEGEEVEEGKDGDSEEGDSMKPEVAAA
ncbi:hypothetical protein HDU76_004631, partial [Blyttiomyces sp. JEL0837]